MSADRPPFRRPSLRARLSRSVLPVYVALVVGYLFLPIAVMMLFSSLVNGIGDVGIYVLGVVTAGIAGSAGNALHSPAVARAAEEVSRFLTPAVRLGFLAGDGRVPWFEAVSYLSTVTLCVALAIVVVNRKELSYASG